LDTAITMIDYTLRSATSVDTDALAAFLRSIKLSDHAVLAAGTRYGLVFDSEALIGAVGLELGQGVSLLRSAGVAPASRGKGLGVALTQAALEAAAAHGPRVYLFSTGAGAYWQRFGFVEVPVDELVRALPDAPQVRYYAANGWLPSEIAWRLEWRA
jgi:N-acetylglutamate synthase-like GNAT family acetyltransferase